MIFYTLYGEKGFRGETAARGGWGRHDGPSSTARTRPRPAMAPRRIDCPTVDPECAGGGAAGVGMARPEYYMVRGLHRRHRGRNARPADRRRTGVGTSQFPGIIAHESAMQGGEVAGRAPVSEPLSDSSCRPVDAAADRVCGRADCLSGRSVKFVGGLLREGLVGLLVRFGLRAGPGGGACALCGGAWVSRVRFSSWEMTG